MTDTAKSRKSVHISAKDKVNDKERNSADEAQRRKRKSSASQGSRKSVKTSNRYSVAGHLIANVKAGERTLQATYRLVSQAPLNLERMYNITKYTVDTAIAASALERYNPSRANRFCQSLAREIQKRIVYEEFDRFRIIAMVTMMEKGNQSGQMQLGFLWESEQDQWTDYHYECRDFVINALVVGVYYEWVIQQKSGKLNKFVDF